MSSRDESAAGTLARHRRELDAHFEILKTVREYLAIDAAESSSTAAAIAELRAEIRAVANRVEALTRSVGANGGEHSIRAVPPAVGFDLVVVDVESDEPELLGSYLRTVEDVVEYVNADNLVRSAPADCVKVATVRELPRILREAART